MTDIRLVSVGTPKGEDVATNRSKSPRVLKQQENVSTMPILRTKLTFEACWTGHKSLCCEKTSSDSDIGQCSMTRNPTTRIRLLIAYRVVRSCSNLCDTKWSHLGKSSVVL